MEYISESTAVASDAMTPDDILAKWNGVGNSNSTLVDHDKKFHKHGFRAGDTCKFRENMKKEDTREDDLPLSRNGKPNKFDIPQLPEDIDIGTDPLEEIVQPTNESEMPPSDNPSELEAYAEEELKKPSYSIWENFDDDDVSSPEESLGELFDDDIPNPDDEEYDENVGLQDDFFSWLDSLNSNPYKKNRAQGPRTDYIWKPEKKKSSFSDPLPPVRFKDGTTLENGDITKFSGDAIVNAANKWMLGGGGVDGAIHRAAGSELLEECKKIAPYDVKNGFRCKTGDAKITKAGNLPCRYVVHTVGPDMYAKEGNESENLASAYRKSMQIAYANGCKSIAFPSISTGIFAFPLEQAAHIAASEIHKFEDAHPDFKVTMCLTKKNMDAYKKAFEKLNGKKQDNGV